MSYFRPNLSRVSCNVETKEFADHTFYYIKAEIGQTNGELKGKFTPATGSFYIVDVMCSRENHGVGSYLLMHAIDLAKNLGATSVDGYLAVVDHERFDKLNHFYNKFGFVITPSTEEGKLATIHLNL